MRFPPRLYPAWVIALILVISSVVPAQEARGQQVDSLPDLPWASIYFAEFDPAARAAGLEPLRSVRLPAGEREVRIWTLVEIAIPRQLYRFVDRGGRVTGELIYHWPTPPPDTAMDERPGETTHDLMVYSQRGRCDRFAVAEQTGICRARFTRTPDWGSVLRTVESHGLWTIPDPSTLPPDSVVVFDGWTIVVEVRDSSGYRTYRYNNPDSHPKWPSAAQVAKVASALGGIDSLVAPSEVTRVYRGVTTGKYESAFRSCEGGDEWEFHADLRSLARNVPTSVRAAFPDSAADTTATGGQLFYVEVLAELTPEWVARDWGSKFPRALQVLELRDVRHWTGVECRAR